MDELWVDLDVTMNQLKGLCALSYYDERTIGSLAGLLRLSKASASVLVDQLIQRGLVARTEDFTDRRRSMIRFTSFGKEVTSRLRIGSESHMLRWLHALSDADLRALMHGLHVLTTVAGEDQQARQHHLLYKT